MIYFSHLNFRMPINLIPVIGNSALPPACFVSVTQQSLTGGPKPGGSHSTTEASGEGRQGCAAQYSRGWFFLIHSKQSIATFFGFLGNTSYFKLCLLKLIVNLKGDSPGVPVSFKAVFVLSASYVLTGWSGPSSAAYDLFCTVCQGIVVPLCPQRFTGLKDCV